MMFYPIAIKGIGSGEAMMKREEERGNVQRPTSNVQCFNSRGMLLLLCVMSLWATPLTAQQPATGMAVDKSGGPTVDPTKNVLDLVEQAIKRQDDLREMNDKLTLSELKRIDELRAAESRRIDEEALLRSEHQKELNLAEASRINAIRAVDVGNVSTANDRNTQQASVLANQVTASAEALRTQQTVHVETLRNLVATTAAAQALQTQQQNTAITERLTALEKTANESRGRSGVSDPQLERLNALVEKLSASQSTGAGKSEGMNATFALMLAIGALVIGGLTLLLRQSRANGKALKESRT